MDNIRQRALTRRNALSDVDRKEKSKVICEKLQSMLTGCVAMYHAIGSEVDLSYLNTENIKVCLPVCEGNHMDFYFVNQDTMYKESTYGILEPVNGKLLDPNEIDMFLVPLVAFDEVCNRMGHGKGYYDRYLPLSKGKRIGVAFECQKDQLYLHEHDVPLDYIVTEKNIYKNPNQE